MWKRFVHFMTKPMGKRSTYVDPIDKDLKDYINRRALLAAFVSKNFMS